MRLIGSFLAFIAFVAPTFGATFGPVVPMVGGAADLVLDEPRNRLYLVNSSLNQIQIYQTNFSPPRLQTSIRVCNQPIAAVLSQDTNLLYVTCYSDSSLAVLNINAATPTTARSPITLPASPEGIALGGDGKIVITTIGTGQGRQTLLSYDPFSRSEERRVGKECRSRWSPYH